MRNRLIGGLLVVVVIIAAGVVWSIRTKNNAPASPIAAIPQAQPVSQALIASSTKQTGKGTTFHFYSPLHDPPPVATQDQLDHWRAALHTTLLNDIKPNLAGPRLASVYEEEANKANKDDVQAAKALFDGLTYCQADTEETLDTKQALDHTLERMRATNTDRDGLHTDNLVAAIADVKQQYSYCAGLSKLENMSTIDHWAGLAVKSGDPATLVWAEGHVGKIYFARPKTMSIPTWDAYIKHAQARNRTWTKIGEQTGVAEAWFASWAGYRDGSGGYPFNSVRAYASLYTEYMLTKSPDLAHQIWQQSQHLNPLQLQEGEALARRNYKMISAKGGLK